MTDKPKRQKPTKGTASNTYQPAGAGSGLQGEAHGRSKLTEDMVMAARRLVRQGASLLDIAATFGVDKSTLSRAVSGKTWSHLRGAVDSLV